METSQSSILLGVNIDHVAAIREQRGTPYPNPLQAAFVVEQAGADSITLHLREDRRHINENDVMMIKANSQLPMNLEIALNDEILAFARQIQPEAICLVPEKREELTTEGGLDVIKHFDRIKSIIGQLEDMGSEVSIFIEPNKKQLEAAREVGVRVVELHTGHFANGADGSYEQLIEMAEFADDQLGLTVNAGHGLNYQNVQLIAMIPQIAELNIGHAIISRAVFTGLDQAVKDMKQLIAAVR